MQHAENTLVLILHL